MKLRLNAGEKYVLHTPGGFVHFSAGAPEQEVPDEFCEALLAEQAPQFDRDGGQHSSVPRFVRVETPAPRAPRSPRATEPSRVSDPSKLSEPSSKSE